MAPEGPGRGVAVEYFTDPLCAWSWAFEGPLRRLRDALGDRLPWRVRMGGLIPGWDRYDDPVHCVSRPAQMAPHWFEVRRVCGVDLDERLWLEDPPASSYPACLAVKAAELQSPEAADLLLGRLREAVMRRRRNIARWDVLRAVAAELAVDEPGRFDAERFSRDLDGDESADLLREDLRRVRDLQIVRFPALVVSLAGRPSALLVGYRPYDELREALDEIAPHLRDRPASAAISSPRNS